MADPATHSGPKVLRGQAAFNQQRKETAKAARKLRDVREQRAAAEKRQRDLR
jgi:hypothetical protein